ncbi:MAG: DNA gyrase subunit A [Candidatus Chisholmbacteria bacterium RIFCSPLOWO2_01_FULL_50_28]|uniref:DNA gyrase subunit A n=1 Tax=Candidatus Chisholmbacteria bacterium RIFCSPHIGHO2_01_FULL_52_32 TaxID=1797591 RepID=A0A1G1VSC9_9BACT|nr:MAG: DNA gyrase subunit A [Candidatus Chisholmbacteria bacterium RIFCSPHIGHO2_01_FULL_52_32]OGY20317.1 MAG: DNA gyrase subunit A [Candidatus Chisholmbacteria bacterium RIFCSPLOWO2_01_FULL_50_28]
MDIGKLLPTEISQEMQRSYLDYAMSVIVARALPDVRDGLKPVHRRILFAMHGMNLTHASAYKKSARIVGEVLGKYHPHGDMAVYDALVRLAQDFSMRYPLVDGQGNFGSVDGDSPAAMRYTEARLARISQALLADLEKETVNFTDNFDGSQKEPSVLPGLLPNLLIMGSDGIAVGMATKIPPHNLGEVADAIDALLKTGKVDHPEPVENPETSDPQSIIGTFVSEVSTDELLNSIKGPDFPTGGTIYDSEAIHEVYATGKGKIMVRGMAEIEQTKSGKMQIVITELPYQVNKARLVEKIADLVKDKRIVGIADLRDESDRHGMRVAIDLKRDAKPKAILNNLFKHTELEQSFPANMVALNHEGTPQLMTLKTILSEYIRHRQLVVVRRSQFELRAARARAHILEGLIIALDHLDAVISTIRRSPDADIAKERLMKNFKLTDIQAQAILDMQLRRLAALERQKIQDEYKAIRLTIEELLALLKDPKKILSAIGAELRKVRHEFADDRRTRVNPAKLKELGMKDLVPSEEVLVTVTETGYLKRMPIGTYRSQHRGGKGVSGMTTKEEDTVAHLLTANTHDAILFFTDRGKVYKLVTHEIPQGSRQSKGQAVINLININQDERIQTILPIPEMRFASQNQYLLMATRKGVVKKSRLSGYANIKSNGLIAIVLTEGDELVWVKVAKENDHVILATKKGKSIRFSESQVRPTARDTMGVRGIELAANDLVVGVEVFTPLGKQPKDRRKKFFKDLFVVTDRGMGKRTPLDQYPLQHRGGQGVKVATLSDRTGDITSAMFVDQTTDQIILTSHKAQVIKLPLKNIPRLKRATQGVILMRFAKAGDKVAAVASLVKEDEADQTPAAPKR